MRKTAIFILAITTLGAAQDALAQEYDPYSRRAYCEGVADASMGNYGGGYQSTTSALINGLARAAGDLISGRDPSYSAGSTAENAIRGAGSDVGQVRASREVRERQIQICINQARQYDRR